MSIFKKKEKRIPEGNYRIIKIGKDALYEFIYESFMDKLEMYLDISDATSVVNFFDVNWEKGEFIFVSRNELENKDMFETIIDTKKLLSILDCTCETVFTDKCYVDLTEEEIIELQS